MPSTPPSPARLRVLQALKSKAPCTTATLAEGLDMTAVAVRQHLAWLEAEGLVVGETGGASGRGRPAIAWRLTPAAAPHFPDRHGELTVGLLEAVRTAVGDDGLARVIDARGDAQSAQYAARLPGPEAGLRARLGALARERTREGYMAAVERVAKGTWHLIEHHCPICEAATACQGLCRVELEVFRRALGPDVEVERVAHLLSGDTRCVYRVREKTDV